jgi:hypothetical protein
MEPQVKYVTLGNIVGAFKTSAASRINLLRGRTGMPVWQRNYYERIIRSEREAEKIREYIDLNPGEWELDRDNPRNDSFDQPARSVDDYLDDLHLR